MTLAIFTRQIGHYHNARYRGAAAALGDVTVISTANQGGFAEFLYKEAVNYEVVKVFEAREAYDAAVADGTLGPATEAALSAVSPSCIAVSGWTNPEAMTAIRWGIRNQVPLVMMSESQADDAGRSALRETVKARVVSLCDAALVGGPPHADYISALGIARDRIHFGYNAVDNDFFAAGAAAARADEQALRAAHCLPARYLLASARFIEKKNLPVLVEAYGRALHGAGLGQPDLVILGDGEERTRIAEAARASGVEARVHLPGYKGYKDLTAFYGLADGFVHVSTVEQWGLVVNEAMAAGLPVIVSDRCGVCRTVLEDGVNGFVTAPDVDAITVALGRFLALTPNGRAAMGEAASAAIASWGPERFGAGMKAAVASAMAAPRRKRLAPWDGAVLSWMERRVIEAVA
ncbi:MAG: glycosyltransferase [Pseudomonadota bacterium]